MSTDPKTTLMSSQQASESTNKAAPDIDELAIFEAFAPESKYCWTAVLNHSLDDEQQTLIAELIEIWRQFHFIDVPIVRNDTFQQMRLAVALALSAKNLELAKAIKDQLNATVAFYKKRTSNPLFAGSRALLYGPDQPKHTRILLGLFSVLYIAMPVTMLFWSQIADSEQILGLSTNEFLIAMVFGSLGSVISIMLRYDKTDVTNAHNSSLFFMGFFKPITGAVFALIALGIFKSGILPIKLNETANAESYFSIPLFFLSGFSERFIGDMLSKVESVASSQNDNPDIDDA